VNVSLALNRAKNILSEAGIQNPALDAAILLGKALNCSKEKIIFNPDLILSQSEQEQFFLLIDSRSKRIPVSHLIGKREFFGLDYIVTQDVLDPRPDSESLIELAFEIFPIQKHSVNNNFKILELGSGSGCLIITLLKYYNLASGVASDISSKALEICKANAIFQQIDQRLEFIIGDLFDALKNNSNPEEKFAHQFDLIISNPPYIATKDIELLEPEVKLYEPRIALDGGESGLDFYQKIAIDAKNFLNKNGVILLEIGQNQENQIIEIFSNQKFILQKSKKDLSGITRILCFEIIPTED
jgi:release factor glutamine methyltransferase